MSNIQQKQDGFQKSETEQTNERIDRLRIRFLKVSLGDQETILKMLAEEIENTGNETVKLWLVRFRDTLELIHQAAFERRKAEAAANV